MKYCIFLIFLWSCNSKAKKTVLLTIEPGKDSCYLIHDLSNKSVNEISRKMKILENSLTDTVVFCSTALAPGYIGTALNPKPDNSIESVLDIEELEFWPKSKEICIFSYRSKPVKGRIVIECYVE